jgi:transcriptional regulator with XRE-family HTH domain
MIANERQHKIAAAEIKRFEKAIAQARADGPTADVHPRIHSAMIAGMDSQLGDLREQVDAYQALREGKVKGRVLHSIREFPDALLEGRIARRFTQKQLGQKLGVPEQQIQRYEQTRYSGASIERLGEVAEALQLTIRKTIEYHIPSAASDQAARRRAGKTRPSARRFSGATRTGGAMAGRSTGKAAASSAGKTLRSKSASKAAKRAAASDLSQVGNRKKTSSKAASAAGKTLTAKSSSKPARKAAASDLSQAARKKKS